MRLLEFLKFVFLTTLIIVAFAILGTAFARDTVIVLSPHASPTQKRAEIERLAHHFLSTVEPGETAHVLNGAELELIGSFAVPSREAYKNKRAKVNANPAFFRALKAFADRAAVDGGPIDLPAVLRHVGDYFPAARMSNLIIRANPVGSDPRQPSLSMMLGAVPNDGHVHARVAQSPYGTAGRKDRLKNYRVIIGMDNTDWQVHAQHFQAVRRFVALSVSAQGGVLIGFTADLSTVYRLAGSDAKALSVAPLMQTDKLEMIAFMPDEGDLPVIYDREITAQAPSTRTVRFAERLQIGIAWHNCDRCDLDIFARPHEGADVIYFGAPNSPEGRLFKDFTRSPATSNGFETIAFSEPVDLNKLVLAVNFYGGAAPDGITGEVRIGIGSRTWAAPFVILAQTGNGGDGANVAMSDRITPNAGWVVLDPLAIVGLH